MISSCFAERRTRSAKSVPVKMAVNLCWGYEKENSLYLNKLVLLIIAVFQTFITLPGSENGIFVDSDAIRVAVGWTRCSRHCC